MNKNLTVRLFVLVTVAVIVLSACSPAVVATTEEPTTTPIPVSKCIGMDPKLDYQALSMLLGYELRVDFNNSFTVNNNEYCFSQNMEYLNFRLIQVDVDFGTSYVVDRDWQDAIGRKGVLYQYDNGRFEFLEVGQGGPNDQVVLDYFPIWFERWSSSVGLYTTYTMDYSYWMGENTRTPMFYCSLMSEFSNVLETLPNCQMRDSSDRYYSYNYYFLETKVGSVIVKSIVPTEEDKKTAVNLESSLLQDIVFTCNIEPHYSSTSRNIIKLEFSEEYSLIGAAPLGGEAYFMIFSEDDKLMEIFTIDPQKTCLQEE